MNRGSWKRRLIERAVGLRARSQRQPHRCENAGFLIHLYESTWVVKLLQRAPAEAQGLEQDFSLFFTRIALRENKIPGNRCPAWNAKLLIHQHLFALFTSAGLFRLKRLPGKKPLVFYLIFSLCHLQQHAHTDAGTLCDPSLAPGQQIRTDSPTERFVTLHHRAIIQLDALRWSRDLSEAPHSPALYKSSGSTAVYGCCDHVWWCWIITWIILCNNQGQGWAAGYVHFSPSDAFECMNTPRPPFYSLIFLSKALLFILVHNHRRLLQRMSASTFVARIYYSFSLNAETCFLKLCTAFLKL